MALCLLKHRPVSYTHLDVYKRQVHPGATGLGSRPTVNDDAGDVTCETFLPGFSGDVYGETARLVLCRYLWPTRKFESVDALRQMVQRAAAAALEGWQGV